MNTIMRLRSAGFAVALALLCACSGGEGGSGGSTGGNPPFAQPTTLSGTVAADIALAGYLLDFLSPAGSSVAQGTSATAAADGSYSVTTNHSLPLLIRAGRFVQDGEPQYPRLTSIALRGGTVNATPLTSLLVARLLNRKPAFLTDVRAVHEIQNRSDADISAARQQVVAYLLTRPSKNDGSLTRPVDVAAVTDFVSMPLNATPGDPHFEALLRLHDSLMDSETIDGVEEHMLFGNDPAANLLAMLDLDFVASCTVHGLDNGTLPRGSARVVLNPSAITLGNFVLPFQNGNRLTVTAGQTRDNQWVFQFPGGQASVELNVAQGHLASVRVSVPAQDSLCVPGTDLSLTGKHPSLIALAKMLNVSLPNPSFQCAAPIEFSGFQVGANFLIIQQNGALRFNGPGGPALHLPSLNITVNTSLIVTNGQAIGVQLESFAADRVLRGGLDEFVVRRNNFGISGVRLIRQNTQSSQSQTCGIV
jgi:hypothetical protein